MIRWTSLAIAAAAFPMLWGVGPGYAMGVAFAVLFTNFATFCLLYDKPRNRARLRMQERLRQMNPNTDVAQRLSTARIDVTAADRQLGVNSLTVLNLATGLAAAGLLIWGVMLRAF